MRAFSVSFTIPIIGYPCHHHFLLKTVFPGVQTTPSLRNGAVAKIQEEKIIKHTSSLFSSSIYSPMLDLVRNFIFFTAAAGSQALIIFHAAEHKNRKDYAVFKPAPILKPRGDQLSKRFTVEDPGHLKDKDVVQHLWIVVLENTYKSIKFNLEENIRFHFN